jgi:hypothetical protein
MKSEEIQLARLWSGLEVDMGLIDRHPATIDATERIDRLSVDIDRSEQRRTELEAELSDIGAELKNLRVAVALGESKRADLDKVEQRESATRDDLTRATAEIDAQRQALGILRDRRKSVIEAVRVEVASILAPEGKAALSAFLDAYNVAMEALTEVLRVHKTMTANGLRSHVRSFPTFPDLEKDWYISVARRDFGGEG